MTAGALMKVAMPENRAACRGINGAGELVLLVLRMLWALPCSFIGTLLGLPLLCVGANIKRVGRTWEIALADTEMDAPRWAVRFQFSAITLGHVIIGASHDTLAHWRPHEHVHVQQYERWGVFFFFAYPAASLWAWARGDCPYLGNAFERQAYAVVLGQIRPDS